MLSLLLVAVIPALVHSYRLSKELNSTNFFDGSYWSWFTGGDPTHGYVHYVDKGTAQSKGYIKTQNGQQYIGCDHQNVASGSGRDSVRVTSKPSYNGGLFILYLSHMPTGCGTWPAWWTVGPNWPSGGEIDIIEQVDVANRDSTTLHTNQGCDMTNAPKNYTGQTGATNCYSASNIGCGITCTNSNSFGAAFNSKNGGLYAMEWTSKSIQMWMWNEGSIPNAAKSDNPDTSKFGRPYAQFYFGSWCPATHFKNHQVVFDLTFCGDWDGAVFGQDCPGKGNCNDYVKNNPSSFQQAYWNIHFMKVFQ